MEIFWSEKLRIPKRVKDGYKEFVEGMSKRLAQGHARYGVPDKRKMYMTRLEIEVREYRRTGNCEHLYNAGNYALLESLEPENKKFHYRPEVGSVTRGKGME